MGVKCMRAFAGFVCLALLVPQLAAATSTGTSRVASGKRKASWSLCTTWTCATESTQPRSSRAGSSNT